MIMVRTRCLYMVVRYSSTEFHLDTRRIELDLVPSQPGRMGLGGPFLNNNPPIVT